MLSSQLHAALKSRTSSLAGFCIWDFQPTEADWGLLRGWLEGEGILSRQRKAIVLGLLLTVARDDYGLEGREFWLFVAEHTRMASLLQKHQKLCGEWAADALRECGYLLRTRESFRFIGPILFHAGVGVQNYGPLLEHVLRQLNEYGPGCRRFDAAQVAAITPEIAAGRGLYRSTIGFLCSRFPEVREAWEGLCELLIRRQATPANFETGLDRLPEFFDRTAMRAALESLGDPESRMCFAAVPVPVVRFQPEYGCVVVETPGVAGLRILDAQGKEIPLGRVEPGLNPCRAIHGTLGADVTFDLGGVKSSLAVFDPVQFPGIWFRPQCGRLHTGPVTPGTWLLVVETEKIDYPEAEVLRIDWAFLTDGPWKAFRIRVPEGGVPTVGIGGKRFAVPLVGDARVLPQFADGGFAARIASGDWSGESVRVLAALPRLKNPRSDLIVVRAECIAEGTKEDPRDIEIAPNASGVVGLSRAGVWRLSFRSGSGRQFKSLGRVAFVPGLTIEPTRDTHTGETVSLGVAHSACGRIGVPTGWEETPTGMTGPTLAPAVTLTWNWTDSLQPGFSWDQSIRGVRWRLHTLEGAGEWTREPVEILASKTFASSARLQMEVPPGSRVPLANGKDRPPDATSDSADRYEFQLKGHATETFDVSIRGCPTTLVYLSARAHLSAFQTKPLVKEIEVGWAGTLPAAQSILAWSLDRPWEAPREFAAGYAAKGNVPVPLDPKQPWAIAVGRKRLLMSGTTWEIAWKKGTREEVWSLSMHGIRVVPVQLALLHHYRRFGGAGLRECLAGLTFPKRQLRELKEWCDSLGSADPGLHRELRRWAAGFDPVAFAPDDIETQAGFMDDLGRGSHPWSGGEAPAETFGWFDVQDHTPALYPRQLFRVLRVLRTPLADHFRGSLPRARAERFGWVIDRSRGVYDVLESVDLMELSLSLPLTDDIAAAPRADCRLIDQGERPRNHFPTLLGLRGLSLRVLARHGRAERTADWTVSADSGIGRWRIDRNRPGILLPPLSPKALAERIDLRSILGGFSLAARGLWSFGRRLNRHIRERPTERVRPALIRSIGCGQESVRSAVSTP